MKITKRQLRSIVEKSLLAENWGQKHGYAADEAPTLEDAMHGIKETLKAAERRRARAVEEPDLEGMFLEDAEDLEFIVDLFKQEIDGGAVPGKFSKRLKSVIRMLDTAVREDIHPLMYYSIYPDLA